MNNPFGQDINEDVKNLLEEIEETSGFNSHPQKAAKSEAEPAGLALGRIGILEVLVPQHQSILQ